MGPVSNPGCISYFMPSLPESLWIYHDPHEDNTVNEQELINNFQHLQKNVMCQK